MENSCTGEDMGASSFTPLPAPNPPWLLGSESRSLGLCLVHLNPMGSSALPQIRVREEDHVIRVT